jgi:hypothetical protein
LELTTPQGTIKGLSIKEALDVRLQNLNALELRKQELEIRAGERPALRVETSGNVNLGDLAGQLDLVVPVFNENLFALVPTEAAKTLPKVERLTLTAKLAASVKDKGKTAAVTGTIDIPQATVDTGTVRTPPDLQAKMELDVEQAGGSEIRIRKFGVLATQAQKPVAHLAVDGTCYLPPVKKESTLTIRSDGADLKWLASLAPKAPPPVEKPAAPPAPRNVGPIGLTVEPAAVDLKGLWLTTKLDLRNLLYGELAVSELRGTTRVKDNTVEIKPLDIVINSAPFHLEALADLNQPGYKYQATAKLGTLRLEPFIATFAPAMRNQLQGQLKSFDLKAGGAGLTPANLSRNFVGGIDLQADQIKLQNLPALMEIATKTGVPELQTILFDKATVKMQNENGRMRLSDVALAGQELRMEVVGTVDFDARLDVQTRIGVGGNLENRLRLKLGPLFEPKQGDYSYLRTPIALKGYPGQQQPTQIVLSMIQQAIGQAATNALGAVIKSQLEGKKLDTKSLLGNFLNPGAASGTTAAPAAPATTTTPAGQATPAKASRNESLLNLLQSAVAQPAAAQTAAPGTATAPSAAPATAAQPAETQPPPAQPDQPKTEKQKRNDAVRDIGTSLFNSLLQGK